LGGGERFTFLGEAEEAEAGHGIRFHGSLSLFLLSYYNITGSSPEQKKGSGERVHRRHSDTDFDSGSKYIVPIYKQEGPGIHDYSNQRSSLYITLQ